jgi:predicted DNA-binding transcriptional regulator YafY
MIGPGYGSLEEVSLGVTRYRTQVDDLDELAHFLVGLHAGLTILNPPALRESFRRIAHELLELAEAG